MDGHFSDFQRIIKNGQKSDSFTDHYEQQFQCTISHTDLLKCMMFKEGKNINPIGAINHS